LGLNELALENVERNGTDERHDKEKNAPGKDFLSFFRKTKIRQLGCPKNAALEELYASIRLVFFILDP
jgi:hypothetical protein